jgi:hypothetical protein
MSNAKNSYYGFTMQNLTIHQRMNAKQLLANSGVRFQFYSLKNVGITIGADKKVYYALPGIYEHVQEFAGDINNGAVRHAKK